MRLKELEIQGFKSFPDRTKITIGAGITGVVGPNGSGKSNISDAFEALIAALYLDGGIETARAFILPFITEGATAAEDFKTRLQELVQERPGAQLQYTVVDEQGPDHDKTFTVEVALDGRGLARGTGRSKKAAEQQAASQALERLQAGAPHPETS